jgi:hypothetical protein
MQEPGNKQRYLHDDIWKITRHVVCMYVHEYIISGLVEERRSRYVEPHGCDIFSPKEDN